MDSNAWTYIDDHESFPEQFVRSVSEQWSYKLRRVFQWHIDVYIGYWSRSRLASRVVFPLTIANHMAHVDCVCHWWTREAVSHLILQTSRCPNLQPLDILQCLFA